MRRAVSFLPDLPDSGEVLMPMVIEIEGSSTVSGGSGRGSAGSARVSPIMMSSMPAMATSSPGPALSRSEEHTSERQSRQYPVCRLLLVKKYHGRDRELHR